MRYLRNKFGLNREKKNSRKRRLLKPNVRKQKREEFNLRFIKERRDKMLEPRKPPAPESDKELSQSWSQSNIPSTPVVPPKKKNL